MQSLDTTKVQKHLFIHGDQNLHSYELTGRLKEEVLIIIVINSTMIRNIVIITITVLLWEYFGLFENIVG